jgi:hypothetical protein
MIRWPRDVWELKFHRHLMVADLTVEKTTLTDKQIRVRKASEIEFLSVSVSRQRHKFCDVNLRKRCVAF